MYKQKGNKVSAHYNNFALITGASGGLGSSLVAEFLNDPAIDKVVAVSRSDKDKSEHPASGVGDKLIWIKSDYSEAALNEVLSMLEPHAGKFSRVCICHGVLHSNTYWPEKRLEDISESALQAIFHANAVVPALWLKSLLKVLKGSQDCIVAALSARVGSIGDNHLGGWYAYRASKSALNMILKTAAIEYGRRAKNVKLIAFHPGTTDTELSKPFQAAVPKEKLFTPSFVAERLAMIMDEALVDGELSYLDWNGQAIDW
jgi:NAD(P)-dependent dehydrogenase (short-subunit alcohol dehydrogenase family)